MKKRPLRFNLWVVILTLAIQALLAFTPLIPITAGLWHTDSPPDFFSSLGTFLGIEFLLLSGAVTLILVKAASDQNGTLGEIEAALPITVIKRLSDVEFYNQFRAAVESAQHSVKIAYFAPYPPRAVQYKGRKRYYDAILELMKRRSEIKFKRVVRTSSQNDPWVADLIRELGESAERRRRIAD